MDGVDRLALKQMLDQGLSLAEIGRRFDRHESTVAYWVQKYELEAVNRAGAAPRGRLERSELERLVVRRLSIAEIASEVGRSKATVRHWLRRYGLRTNGPPGRHPQRERALARAANLEVVVLTCRYHGDTEFWLNARGYYRCKQCRSEAVTRRRRRMKALLVAEAGGACSLCGYARRVWALHFHHVEPSQKRYAINARGAGMALARLRAEADKCVLLCANCHAEVEAGLVALPGEDDARVQSNRGARSNAG
jgi:transposase